MAGGAGFFHPSKRNRLTYEMSNGQERLQTVIKTGNAETQSAGFRRRSAVRWRAESDFQSGPVLLGSGLRKRPGCASSGRNISGLEGRTLRKFPIQLLRRARSGN